jgi:hypothetical protein
MMDYARHRAIEVLRTVRNAVLATNGPAGVQTGEFLCEAVELELFLLVPQTSDHLFNLEQDDRVAVHTEGWELTGKAHALLPEEKHPELAILCATGAEWHILVRVEPLQIHIRRQDGWGAAETIDLVAPR